MFWFYLQNNSFVFKLFSTPLSHVLNPHWFTSSCTNTKYTRASPARAEASSCTSCAGSPSSWLDTAGPRHHPHPHLPVPLRLPGHGRPPESPDCGGQRSARSPHLHGDRLFRFRLVHPQRLTPGYKTRRVLKGFISRAMKRRLEKWWYLWY